MALTGLQIQKLLPKTNCKECGSSTCMAFAMKLAARKANLDECPYASDELKQVLGADAEPPVRTVRLGSLDTGGETVLYRHDKTFVNRPLLAVDIGDTADGNIDTLEAAVGYELERVGEVFGVDAISLTQSSANPAPFLEIAGKAAGLTEKPIIIRARDLETTRQAAQRMQGRPCLLYGATTENIGEYLSIAAESGHKLALCAGTIDELTRLSGRCMAAGFRDLLLEMPNHPGTGAFQYNSIARRAAIRQKYKPLGFPTIRYISGGCLIDDTLAAVTEINKYGGVIVLPTFDKAQLATLMTLRLGIFTDPQKPVQVEPRVYPIGEPDRASAVFVTTNFSLTFFLVSGEIENTGVSAWLLIPECEGMSVLTAWAAGKFSGDRIAKAARELGLEDMVDTRRIIIPGYVSQISGELEEAMPGWTVLVGPQEASDIESFIKEILC